MKGDIFAVGDLLTYDDPNYFGTSAIIWRVAKLKSWKSKNTGDIRFQTLWIAPAFCITGAEIPLKNKRVTGEYVEKLDVVQVGILHQRFVDFIKATFTPVEVKPDAGV